MGQLSPHFQSVESIVLSSGVVVVTVRGDADLRNAPLLRSELERLSYEGWRRAVIDLSEATFIDSAALGTLMGAAKRERPLGGLLRIVAPNPHIRRMFELTLLDRLFGGLHTDVAEAVESLRI